MKNLYLFDIDGTLLDSSEIHFYAFRKCYLDAFGVKIKDEHWKKNFGKTAMGLHASVCKDFGIEFNPDVFEKLVDLWDKYVKEGADIKNLTVLPGAVNFLDDLKKKKELMGIVTGNPERIGIDLLSASGLIDYFEFTSFTDSSVHDRSILIERAIKKAEDAGYKIRKIAVIGDTPKDVIAAKEKNTLAVGVETGFSKSKELYDAGADIVLKTLNEYPKVIERMEA